jgi:hypothetical protein
MSPALRTTLVAAGLALLSAALLVALARPAHAAGQADVRFVEPDQFADIGRGTFERERTLASLAAHFKDLARQLPDGQTLKVEVLDVDLAGELELRRGREFRVLRGTADVPRIRLRWSVAQGGATLKQGEGRLADLGYLLSRPGMPAASEGDLPHEKRLLTRWFQEQVAAPR